MKKYLFAAICVVAIFFTINAQKIYIIANDEVVTSVDAYKGLPLTIKFIHSVQKSPVIEELEFDGKDFILLRTRYQSQGVGLPFMESDGEFRRDGDYFVMDNMNRRIKKLSLRVGVGTELTITLDGQEFKLYERFDAGTKIDVIADRNHFPSFR